MSGAAKDLNHVKQLYVWKGYTSKATKCLYN